MTPKDHSNDLQKRHEVEQWRSSLEALRQKLLERFVVSNNPHLCRILDFKHGPFLIVYGTAPRHDIQSSHVLKMHSAISCVDDLLEHSLV